MSDYAQFQHLLFERKDDGVLLITINRPDKLNAANARLHWELANVWPAVGADEATRVAVITGAGRAFCVGGDADWAATWPGDFKAAAHVVKEASDIVYNIVNLDKPVISAINGLAMGAGLAVALLADISVINEEAKISDLHLRVGVTAGDHALIVWPLLCGMAKAKLYLLTADYIDGREAERIGLVSLCVPPAQVLPKALELAGRLGRGPQMAQRWTKRALNNWLRLAGPIFDQSIALEMLTFMGEDAIEALTAVREKREIRFPSGR
ncbi:MAG: enoyl-CoA hydratase/isomerase family protein [Candidatus Lambdaproteobacteria bacterium]|nr:enoyl-CoA hydratase/isomerase family protein [Candidatus Lambdaproteobacteria bacterium]